MSDAARILAIRHGETAWNVDTRIQGQLDVGLNDTGRWQAERLAQALSGEALGAIYASDLGRAHHTALAISRVTGVVVISEPGLRERHFGEFQGKTYAEIETTLPEQARLWRTRDPAFTPPGGESLLQLRNRVVGTAEKLAARHPGELIALVGHGGVMDVLYRAAARLDIQAPRTWALGNAAINRLLWSPEGFTLVGWADTQHLQHPEALADARPLDETST